MSAPDRDLIGRLEQALGFGREAGDLILAYFRRRDLRVDEKSDASPVTQADREAELLLRDRLRAAFPGDGVLGEEHGEIPGTSGYRWILDPIDGTRSFIHGIPLFGTLIGLEKDGKAAAGVALFPALGEAVYAARGHGAWHARGGGEPEPARVSTVDDLSRALFCLTSPKSFVETGTVDAYRRVQAAVGTERGMPDCYGYLLVATGRAEVMIDPIMNVWDCAPFLPILEEAGGTFTDWSGTPTIHARATVATNRRLLPAVLPLLA